LLNLPFGTCWTDAKFGQVHAEGVDANESLARYVFSGLAFYRNGCVIEHFELVVRRHMSLGD
jgi:hypothetical protein